MPETVASPRWNPWLARGVDVALATLALLLLSPLLLAIAIGILLGGGGWPVLFAQERLGRGGVPFRLHKFRSLAGDGGGALVAPAGDARTTPIGRALRRWRLDELPQLVDVLRGRMALVGPRPEVPANLIAVDVADVARLLTVRPGITGPTQLAFLAEDEVLAACEDPLLAYRRILVPAKVAHDLDWLARRTVLSDLRLLLATPLSLLRPSLRAASRRRVEALLGR